MLVRLRAEAAKQFDTLVWWAQQILDGDGNPASDIYGNPSFNGAVVLPARVVPVNEAFYNMQGLQVVASQKIYLPPLTGVQAGDKLLLHSQDPLDPLVRYPPILEVSHVPSSEVVIYDLVLTGSAA
jgi:hypothetical protein